MTLWGIDRTPGDSAMLWRVTHVTAISTQILYLQQQQQSYFHQFLKRERARLSHCVVWNLSYFWAAGVTKVFGASDPRPIFDQGWLGLCFLNVKIYFTTRTTMMLMVTTMAMVLRSACKVMTGMTCRNTSCRRDCTIKIKCKDILQRFIENKIKDKLDG